MKYSVGYPVLAERQEAPFAEILGPYREHVSEVYFAWPGEASGRMPGGSCRGRVDWDAQADLEDNLVACRGLGLGLNLLLNANCYGHQATSEYLANRVGSIIEHVGEVAGLDSITTTSPFVAEVVKRSFPAVETRASVNMRLGEIPALEYVAESFDGFYLQREYNRDLGKIEELKAWCEARGKSLHLLANSGCLRFCSTQTFHDNLVAHEQELAETRQAPLEVLACRRHLADPRHWAAILEATWIRPEDIHHYEPYFAQVKLATRAHANPGLVIRAYVNESYPGNLLDLLEPGHGPALQGYVLDNSQFPPDWFTRTASCGRQCHECTYCESVLEQILTRL